ncbi:TetR family transcriptional regulator, partial [bacterium]|nr:TetR family transcriptional regulator [bacterium]
MLQFSKQTATQKYNQKLNFVFHTASEVFAKEGYHKASIREIAKETGISLGS